MELILKIGLWTVGMKLNDFFSPQITLRFDIYVAKPMSYKLADFLSFTARKAGEGDSRAPKDGY
jgi:hypothetical protein